MCIRDRLSGPFGQPMDIALNLDDNDRTGQAVQEAMYSNTPVSYTHLRAHETVLDLVCRLLLEKKKKTTINYSHIISYS